MTLQNKVARRTVHDCEKKDQTSRCIIEMGPIWANEWSFTASYLRLIADTSLGAGWQHSPS